MSTTLGRATRAIVGLPMMAPRLVLDLLLSVVFCLALAACDPDSGGSPSSGSPAAPPPPSVTVTPVLQMVVSEEHERVGKVRAVEDVELRARITGFLEQRLFDEGADVERGDVLFVIERAPYEARVARAEADVARARAALEEARLELRRTRRLRGQNVSSEADLDADVAAEAKAKADTLAAKAALTEARLDLDYTRITAPVSGRVGRAIYSVGDLVGPESGTLATLASLDPIYVYWQVPEDLILEYRRRTLAREKRGEAPEPVQAHLRFRDGSVYEHDGVWDFLDNRVDETTGTQTARAVFPNPDGLLLPGQYATVLVQVGESRRALAIPQSAVQEDQAGRFVLVVDSDRIAHVRRVELGARRGIYWEVRSGLSAGDRVIWQGVQKVQPDAPVAAQSQIPEPPVGTAAAEAPTAARDDGTSEDREDGSDGDDAADGAPQPVPAPAAGS